MKETQVRSDEVVIDNPGKGEAAVRRIFFTPDARELLVFSKQTRHLTSPNAFERVLAMEEHELETELDYALGTIGSSWEFVDYVFLLTGVTRAFTHQLVRHRVGVAYAQQSGRLTAAEDFGYLADSSMEDDLTYHSTMDIIQANYKHILANPNARIQDARGMLPTNIRNNILFKVNLRALADLLHIRLCVRAQGEFQRVALAMQELVLAVHPWAKKILGPLCIVKDICAFPNFKDCPIKKKNPHLLGIADGAREGVRETFKRVAGFDPQPVTNKN